MHQGWQLFAMVSLSLRFLTRTLFHQPTHLPSLLQRRQFRIPYFSLQIFLMRVFMFGISRGK